MIRLTGPKEPIRGSIQLPGSKSISNRLLILNALRNFQGEIQNLSAAEDTVLLNKALTEVRNGTANKFDLHHAGTSLRFLIAYLACVPGEWELTGSKRLQERPVGILVDALKELGAEIHYTEKEGSAPLFIRGKNLSGGTIRLNAGISSQFVSALLLISPLLSSDLIIKLQGKTVSVPYTKMTIRLLQEAGMDISLEKDTITCRRSNPIKSIKLRIEADWSAASYFFSICALKPATEIFLQNLDQSSLQGDAVLVEMYKNLGVQATFTAGGLLIRSASRRPEQFKFDFTDCPDLAQTIAVTCYALGITAMLKGLSTLRIKESNRIEALRNELEKLGATVQGGDDYIAITSANKALKKHIENKVILTYQDHRMAMAFAPLALLADILIDDERVVSKSYPDFWEHLRSLGFSVTSAPH